MVANYRRTHCWDLMLLSSTVKSLGDSVDAPASWFLHRAAGEYRAAASALISGYENHYNDSMNNVHTMLERAQSRLKADSQSTALSWVTSIILRMKMMEIKNVTEE